MAFLEPSENLIRITGLCYLIFFAFYGADIFAGVPSVAPDDNVDGIVGFVVDIWTFVTFGVADPNVNLNVFVKGFLFLVVTLRWFLVIINSIIEAVKALGELIPF